MIPRFITELTAFIYIEELEGFIPVCRIQDVTEDENFLFGYVKGFNLFGMMLFPKLSGELFELKWSEIESYRN